ncbi:16743_t:CDS:1, partial [Racocetra persica]
RKSSRTWYWESFGAPTFDWKFTYQDEQLMKEMITYIDSIITAMNPDNSTHISQQYPCQKRQTELTDNFEDYCQLVNRLQKHTKCSPPYCFV